LEVNNLIISIIEKGVCVCLSFYRKGGL